MHGKTANFHKKSSPDIKHLQLDPDILIKTNISKRGTGSAYRSGKAMASMEHIAYAVYYHANQKATHQKFSPILANVVIGKVRG